MPITLDNLSQTAAIKTYGAKFFDKKLTGVGKKVGLLNEEKNPGNVKVGQTTNTEHKHSRKIKYHNGPITTSMLPLNTMSCDAWDQMTNIDHPEIGAMTKITDGKQPFDLYMSMSVHSLTIEESETGGINGGGLNKKLAACYQLFIYAIHDTNTTQCHRESILNIMTSGHNAYGDIFTCNPRLEMNNVLTALINMGTPIDLVAAHQFIDDYDLHGAVVKRSEEWQTTIDIALDALFKNVTATTYDKVGLNIVAAVLHSIEDYSVPLSLYKNIYNSLRKYFTDDEAIKLCKQNLNLLMSYTLNDLDNNRAILTTMQAPNPMVQMPASAQRFSQEQQKAITTTEPLVLVQAGAGTGKSTVILGRLDYMIAAGVDPSDIMVLSFTNAAADNINEKNPYVHSMTIARMIHTIYAKNFTHELSSIETIINSLDIYFPGDDFVRNFRDKLINVNKNKNDSFTIMNNFIERNYDAVIGIMNTIKQTSLELEIIICYQKIDDLVEPPEIASKHLIIDEVQDNSIFEFIYVLKYIDKHKESLFIVGDCSQTLYEFRASNPKALNMLESSGVFTTHQLQINYRSNQEILDFANVALTNIEANQYANIQLQANSLSQMTEQSFTDKVRFKYQRLAKINDFKDMLPGIMAIDIKPYIDEKIAIGEKVAFLAFTRKQVSQFQVILEGLYPDKKIVSLVPDKMYSSTIFSEFIKRHWDEIQFSPTKPIISIIARKVMDHLGTLVFSPDKARSACQKMLLKWSDEQRAMINTWQQQLMNGQIQQNVFLNNIKEAMLQYEIRNNSIKQAVLSARNGQNKKSQNIADADILLSTIHSAKGLEFDNVVVLYRSENNIEEDKKRMYYVALTRAMKSEFILAFDTMASPAIEADYASIVKLLKQKQMPQLAVANMTQTRVIPLKNATNDDDDINTTQVATAV